MHSVPAREACAVLTVNLDALAANWKALRTRVHPAECAAVVKADAYGIGIEKAVPVLAKAGCATFFVAHASEGRRVREALGVDEPGYRIYVLNGLPGVERHGEALTEFGLRPVLSSLDDIRAWSGMSNAQRAGLPAALHFDTGMHRLGIPSEQLAEAKILIAKGPYPSDAEPPRHGNVVQLGLATTPGTKVAARRKVKEGSKAPHVPPGVYVDLVMSHFVSSEIAEDPLNWRQMATFKKLAHEFPGVPASLANSSGIFLAQHPFHDLVRPGYALYGGNPLPAPPNPMRPVLRLQAPIIQLRRIRAGDTVGYNSLWTARRDTRLATVGVGYADGFPRLVGSTDARRDGAEAVLAGARCRVVGRVSMDLTVVDITDAPDGAGAPGAMIDLLNDELTIDHLAVASGNSAYAVLTGLGARYHRIYVGE